MAKTESFDTIKARADKLIDSYSARNTEFDKYERMMKLAPSQGGRSGVDDDAEGNPNVPRVRKLFDPHPHNVIKSVVRMYITNPPTITLAEPHGDAQTEQAAGELRAARQEEDTVEQVLRALLYRSDVVSDRGVVADSLFSAALFGPVTQIIDCALSDLPEGAKPEDHGIESPYLFYSVHPRNSYPRLSRRRGLFQHVYTESLMIAEVKDAYGEKETAHVDGDEDERVTLMDYMDEKRHMVWVDEYDDKPVLDVPMVYDFLPRTYRRGEGVGFFSDADDTTSYEHMPMLFAYLKSGLWAARNVAGSAAYSNLMDYVEPHWVEYLNPGREQQALPFDFTRRGGKTVRQVGERIEPLARQLMPPEYWNYVGMLTQMAEESTVSRVAGDTGATAYAALNLLAQVSISATYFVQKTVADSLAQTFSKTLRWAKKRNEVVSVWGEQREHLLRPSSIKSFEVRVSLRVDRELQRQAIAQLATTLFRSGGLGYSEYYHLLEDGGIVESASEAFDSFIERTLIDANLADVLKGRQDIARKLTGIADQVPETPEPPTGLGQGVENPADMALRLQQQADLSALGGNAPTGENIPAGAGTRPLAGGEPPMGGT